MIYLLLAILTGFALAALTYLVLERNGRPVAGPLLARGIAWSALILLLLNASFPYAGRRPAPIVLLDASLSMTAAGGHWQAARDSARRTGEVRFFGDSRPGADTLPDRGRSALLPDLTAAAASNRPVVVYTDGELDDSPDLPPDLLDRVRVQVFARDSVPDYAVTMVQAPDRVASGDTIPLTVELRSLRGAPARDLKLDVTIGRNTLTTRRVPVAASGVAHLVVPVVTRGLPPGAHLLEVRIADAADAEPRTDSRLVLVQVTGTPGIVLVAAPADWDSRALYRTLRDVARLPVRGYVQLAAGRFRSMQDLSVANGETVRRAARGADLLILKGRAGDLARSARNRGIWLWPSGEDGRTMVPGDWYVSPGGASPVSGAFLGLPLDSFPPLTAAAAGMDARSTDWVALQGRNRRRGPVIPLVTGRTEGNRRAVVVAADGFWRWAFRGGESEQAYRSWVATTVSWLLAAPDTAVGVARATRPVVQQGTPVVFEWTGGGTPHDVPVMLTSDSARETDTLRFAAGGRAAVWLRPGAWSYRLADGGAGVVAVETYSDEFLPRSAALRSQPARSTPVPGRTGVRDWAWLFGVAILAFALEWWWRRRLGLR